MRSFTYNIRTVASALTFLLKVFPMLPSRPVDWLTKRPVIEKVKYSTCHGLAEGDLYLPGTRGPHPGIVICLGVVPFGVEHPQVAVLGNALARSGFAALLYWSPAMRDFRLDPEDIESIAMAYRWLIEQPTVDPARSGLFGTCVGGAFALMASASPIIRDRVGFVGAYAPYSSMWTFAQDIASASRPLENGREPWQVDPLTWKVFLQSITSLLEPGEAGWFRTKFAEGRSIQGSSIPRVVTQDIASLQIGEDLTGSKANLSGRMIGRVENGDLAFPKIEEDLTGSKANLSGQKMGRVETQDGQRVYSLLTAENEGEAENALQGLPPAMQARLSAMSPMNYLDGIQAPLVVILHDRGDPVIPVAESRSLYSGFTGQAGIHANKARIHYTEMQFHHLDPAKGKLPLFRLLGELSKFFRAMYPIFQQVVKS